MRFSRRVGRASYLCQVSAFMHVKLLSIMQEFCIVNM